MTLKEILSGKVAVNCGNREEQSKVENLIMEENQRFIAWENSYYIVLQKYGYCNALMSGEFNPDGYTIITFDELKERLKCQTDI
jgi:hypothetical protein